MPLFFNHIPKTAGTTIQSVLATCAPEHQILASVSEPELNGPLAKLRMKYLSSEVQIAAGHFGEKVRREFFGSFFSLTILRHPVARYYSQLQHHARDMRQFEEFGTKLLPEHIAGDPVAARIAYFPNSMSSFLCPMIDIGVGIDQWAGSADTVLAGMRGYDLVLSTRGVSAALPVLAAMLGQSPPARGFAVNQATDFSMQRINSDIGVDQILSKIFPEDFAAYDEAVRREDEFLKKLQDDPITLLFELKGVAARKLEKYVLDWNRPPASESWGQIVHPAIPGLSGIAGRLVLGKSAAIMIPVDRTLPRNATLLVWSSVSNISDSRDQFFIRVDGGPPVEIRRTYPASPDCHLGEMQFRIEPAQMRGLTRIEFEFRASDTKSDFWLLGLKVES